MPFEHFTFTKSWEDEQAFPTYQPDEKQVRADLQCLHDELRDGLNRLIDALNDPTAAAQLPFSPTSGLTAQTVQDAVAEVYGKVQDAAAGLLVDGTVTREKLAEALLERIYGGKVWVSLEEPDGTCNPAADFPVGQLWLRPAWTLANHTDNGWLTEHCTMDAANNGWILQPDGETGLVTATMNLDQVGKPGSTGLVYLKVTQPDLRLSALTLCLNGVEQDLLEADGLFEAVLDQSGGLELQLEAQWPYAYDGLQIALSHVAVVDAEELQASLPGCRMPRNWERFLEERLPFDLLEAPWKLFLHNAAGQWVQIGQQVLPVSRGGTGLDQVAVGGLLYGGSKTLQPLNPPTQTSFLQYDGAPVWKSTKDTAAALSVPEIVTGSYKGNCQVRTMQLPCTPKLLVIFPQDGPVYQSGPSEQLLDNPVVLANGAAAIGRWYYSIDGNSRRVVPGVKLSGSQLEFYMHWCAYGETNQAALYNRSGVTYNWLAIC